MPVKKQLRNVGRKLKSAAKTAVKAAVSDLRHDVSTMVRGPTAVRIKAARSLITGRGDYRVNRLIGGRSGASPPTFGTTSLTVVRRELLGSIVSANTPGEFKIQKFRLNPADPDSFPWLANIANNFESWEPLGITFDFVSLSGTAVGSTNTALGQLIMAPQYNAYASDPVSKIELEGYPDAVSVCVDKSAICGVECNPNNRQSRALLIRNANVSNVPTSMAAANFDLGDFFVATAGLQAADITVGEIWVNYKIRIWNPIVPRYQLNYVGAQYNKATVASNATQFDSLLVGSDPSSLLVSAAGQSVVFRKMAVGTTWYIEVNFNSSSTIGFFDLASSYGTLVRLADIPTDSELATIRGTSYKFLVTHNTTAGNVAITSNTDVAPQSNFRFRILPYNPTLALAA